VYDITIIVTIPLVKARGVKWKGGKIMRKNVVCFMSMILTVFMFFSSTIVSNASNEKTTIDGMDKYIFIDDEGRAQIHSEEAEQAGYTREMIEYVKGNLMIMNRISKSRGIPISEIFCVETENFDNVVMNDNGYNGRKLMRSAVQIKGVSKVVTTWRSVKIYMNNVDTFIYCCYLQKFVDQQGTLQQTLLEYADYKGDSDVRNAAYFAGFAKLMAWLYLYPAQRAAQPGRGIIMQTDMDYVTMTSTVSYLSQ